MSLSFCDVPGCQEFAQSSDPTCENVLKFKCEKHELEAIARGETGERKVHLDDLPPQYGSAEKIAPPPTARKQRSKPSLSPGDGVPARAEVPSPAPVEQKSPIERKPMGVIVTKPDGTVMKFATTGDAVRGTGIGAGGLYPLLKKGGGQMQRGKFAGWKFEPGEVDASEAAAAATRKPRKFGARLLAEARGERVRPSDVLVKPAVEATALTGKPSDALVLDQATRASTVVVSPAQKSSLRVLFVELSGDDQTLASALKLLENKFAARAGA